MAHPNEITLRKAYDLFAKEDIPGFLALCTPGIRFVVPGQGLLSGDSSRDEFFAKMGPAMQAIGGSFREEVLYAAANDTDGFVVASQQVTRDGQTLRWNAVHHWRFEGGKLARFTEFTDDQPAFERAWRR